MKKISYGQMIMILFLCRVFKSMTYNPFTNANAVTIMITVLISTLIQAVMILPIIWLYVKHPGESVCDLAFMKSKTLGYIVSVLYSLYFLTIALRTVRSFTYFMAQMFPSHKNLIFIAISITIVAGYCAFLGVEAIGRGSTIVFAGFVIMLLLMIINTSGRIDFTNLNMISTDSASGLRELIIHEIGLNSELSAIALLLPKVKKSLPNGAYILLGLKLVAIELIVFLCSGILGDYVNSVPFPFFAVGAYSKTQFIERFDPIYMVEWTLCAVVSISIFITLAGETRKNVFFRLKSGWLKIILTLFMVALLLLPSSLTPNSLDSFFDDYLGTPIMLIMVTIIPLIIALISNKKQIQKS